jgi:hypothetical protein
VCLTLDEHCLTVGDGGYTPDLRKSDELVILLA